VTEQPLLTLQLSTTDLDGRAAQVECNLLAGSRRLAAANLSGAPQPEAPHQQGQVPP
jgi:hypothetical protein